MRSRLQLSILWLAIGLTVVLGLFPPWRGFVRGLNGAGGEWPLDYTFLLHPPAVGDDIARGVALDIPRLLLGWFLVWIVAAGLLATLAVARTHHR